MSNKLKDFLKETKISDGEIHFDALGGMFSKRPNQLIPDDGDEYTLAPGVTTGEKYPMYRITLSDEELNKMNQELLKVYKKAADAMEKVLTSELKKMGFKRTK